LPTSDVSLIGDTSFPNLNRQPCDAAQNGQLHDAFVKIERDWLFAERLLCVNWMVGRGEFVLVEFNIMGLVVNASIKTDLAVAVAMKIPEMDVARVGNFHRPRKRLKRMTDTIAVEIDEGDVVG